MALTLSDANTIVTPIIRSSNKRADFTLALTEGERPGVAVTLTLRRKTTTVTLTEDVLDQVGQNLRSRNQLRTKLKRAMDQMHYVPVPFVSTKLVRALSSQGDGFFRAPGGFRGRR